MRNTLMRMSSIHFPASKSINKLLLDIPKPGKITQDKLYAISHDAKRKDITESKQTQRQQKNNVDSNLFECVHNRKCIGTIRHMKAHRFGVQVKKFCASTGPTESTIWIAADGFSTRAE